jgi:hypothetical protein
VNAGFLIIAFVDQTAGALAQAQARAQAAVSPSGLGLHLLLGDDGSIMSRNGLKNYAEGRIGLVQGLVRVD